MCSFRNSFFVFSVASPQTFVLEILLLPIKLPEPFRNMALINQDLTSFYHTLYTSNKNKLSKEREKDKDKDEVVLF